MRASTSRIAEILQRFAVVTNKSTTLVTEGCRRLRGVAVTSPFCRRPKKGRKKDPASRDMMGWSQLSRPHAVSTTQPVADVKIAQVSTSLQTSLHHPRSHAHQLGVGLAVLELPKVSGRVRGGSRRCTG